MNSLADLIQINDVLRDCSSQLGLGVWKDEEGLASLSTLIYQRPSCKGLAFSRLATFYLLLLRATAILQLPHDSLKSEFPDHVQDFAPVQLMLRDYFSHHDSSNYFPEQLAKRAAQVHQTLQTWDWNDLPSTFHLETIGIMAGTIADKIVPSKATKTRSSPSIRWLGSGAGVLIWALDTGISQILIQEHPGPHSDPTNSVFSMLRNGAEVGTLLLRLNLTIPAEDELRWQILAFVGAIGLEELDATLSACSLWLNIEMMSEDRDQSRLEYHKLVFSEAAQSQLLWIVKTVYKMTDAEACDIIGRTTEQTVQEVTALLIHLHRHIFPIFVDDAEEKGFEQNVHCFAELAEWLPRLMEFVREKQTALGLLSRKSRRLHK